MRQRQTRHAVRTTRVPWKQSSPESSRRGQTQTKGATEAPKQAAPRSKNAQSNKAATQEMAAKRALAGGKNPVSTPPHQKKIITSSPKDENVPFPVNRKKDSDLTGIKPQLFHGTLFSFPADSPLLCKCRKGRGSAMQNWSRAKVYVRPCSYFSHGRMNRVCKVRNLICQFNVHSGRSKSKVQNQSCG